jgi:hypothetical protein
MATGVGMIMGAVICVPMSAKPENKKICSMFKFLYSTQK